MEQQIVSASDNPDRKKAQILYRERYYIRISPYKRFIEKKASEAGCNFQEAANALIDYVQHHDDDGTAQMLIRAALAELQG
jgi:hypothetical protein